MSTPNSSDPFATPDDAQIQRNIQAQHDLEQQQQRAQQEAWAQYHAAQQQWAQQQQQWGSPQAQQQQWASQQWQGQNPGAYPQPAPYQPGSPYPQPQFYAQKPPAPGTAMVALITGILSFFVFPPLGFVAFFTGLSTVRKVKRTGAHGKGQGIAGIVMGSVTSVITIATVIAIFIFIGTATPISSDVDSPRDIKTYRAATGNCLGTVPETDPKIEYSVVPCSQPHAAQIIQIRWLNSSYSGSGNENRELVQYCYDYALTGRTIEELGTDALELFLVVPSPSQLEEGFADEYHCIATPITGKLQGSLLDGTAELVPKPQG